jgi:hypothetical protein
MKAIFAVAGVLAALGMAVLPARADEYSYTRTVDRMAAAAGAAVLNVTAINGNVHLIAGDGTAVRVHAVLKARSADVLSLLEVRTARVGGTLRLQEICPTTRHLFFWSVSDCDIELEVHYPRALAVNLQSQNGNVAVDGSTAGVSVTNGNGNIEVNGVRGAIRVKNGNGNVDISDASTNLTVTNTNGNVSAALANPWHGSAIAMSTNAGNVELRVPAGFDAKLSARTRMGDVRNHANLRSGPITVTATTTFGNVVINRD